MFWFHSLFRNLALLLGGINFLKLRGPHLNFFRFWYPAICTSVVLVLSYVQSNNTSFTTISYSSLYRSAFEIVGTMVGFYIAAVAVLSSLKGEYLDETLSGEGLRYKEVGVSRRQFLVSLFSFAIFVSAILLVLPPVAGLVWSLVESWMPASSLRTKLVELISVGFVLYLLATLLFTTLVGLTYLSRVGDEESQ